MRALLACVLVASSVPVLAQKATTPKMGSAERTAILDAIRPRTEKAVGMKVKFEVTHLKVAKGFAFLMANPVRTNGKKIDWTKTRYAQDIADGIFDPSVMALFKKSGKTWKVLEWSFGATDYPAEEWVKNHHAPRTILNIAG